MRKLLSGLLFAVSGLAGTAVFLAPFFWPQLTQSANPTTTPLLTSLLLVICLVVLLLELQGEAISARVVAMLGMLVAITAVLRFLEVAFPGPGGFSPIFAPILLAGYVFGARFGFLMGALTLLVSALVTGGVGPWLPYQMFAAGWVGLTAAWLPHPDSTRRQVFWLSIAGLVWGFLYGLIMNLYFWPFFNGDAALSWQAGVGWRDTLSRYVAFYLVTSLVWDAGRALGNVALIGLLGAPVIHIFTRFQRRMMFQYVDKMAEREVVRADSTTD
ncbi:MAG: ECF transporter S component [Chloroflexi bacterium]|nr:MAG: ECF transporter S component [Chloroflexota bacterium]